MDWKDLTHGILFLLEDIINTVAVVRVNARVESTTAQHQQALGHLR